MPSSITLTELTEALANDELVFYYQPKISLVNGRLNGAEALVRWQRSDGTMVMPGDFIPLAENSGFITEISLAMFPRLVADMLIINDIDRELTTSFNLSAQDFESSDMLDTIVAAVTSKQLDARCLEVELTEASLIRFDDLAVRENLRALGALGVTLTMDDYGTGYSSIDSLSQWPFDNVKLDKELIARMQETEKATTIVQASIRMAHQLGMRVVAEGIETSEVYDFLLHSGCTDAQGFWLSRPMPLDEYLAFIRNDRRWSGMPTGLIHMAILDHIHWRQALISQVTELAYNGGVAPIAVRSMEAELDPHHCRLGMWYYGPGQAFRGNVLFDRLERPHTQLHALGRELLEAAKSGAPREELIVRLRQLTKQSAVLLEILQALESEAMIDNDWRGQAGSR